jgi:hypothetical protein
MIHEAIGFGSSTGIRKIFGFPTAYHTGGTQKQAPESCSLWRGFVSLLLNRNRSDALRFAIGLPIEFIGQLEENLHALLPVPALPGIPSRGHSRLLNFSAPMRF